MHALRHRGSSPLTRGKPRRNDARPSASRLIPAHAGKTGTTSCIRFSTWAHPRSRGENGWVCPWRWSRLGSSPLTRGKRWEQDRRNDPVGLIPAHAGKTFGGSGKDDEHGAHPRSRGENEAARQPHGWETGSSPLTRGKRSSSAGTSSTAGLIPAHAGKTRRRFRRSYVMGAHPRSRGENGLGRPGLVWDGGSSPLTRGKPVTPGGESVKEGLIPAHAGKT